jgi:hypothetical protein
MRFPYTLNLVASIDTGDEIVVLRPEIPLRVYGPTGHVDVMGLVSATLGNVRWTAAILKGLCRTPSKKSFQEEFRRLLTKYGLDVDERYVWD